jgi:hypothetical protein
MTIAPLMMQVKDGFGRHGKRKTRGWKAQTSGRTTTLFASGLGVQSASHFAHSSVRHSSVRLGRDSVQRAQSKTLGRFGSARCTPSALTGGRVMGSTRVWRAARKPQGF